MEYITIAASLRSLIKSGLTTRFAISVATGISDVALSQILSAVPPSDEQVTALVALLRSYRYALALVNTEMTKARFLLALGLTESG